IMPAAHFVFLDIIDGFEDRFPGEPFFVKKFSFANALSPKDLAPIVSSAHARREQADRILNLTSQNILPLGFAAHMTGAPIPDVMAALSRATDPAIRIHVEWGDRDGQTESRSAAAESRTLVLTRSSLHMAEHLRILEILRSAYELIAPRS